MKKHFFKSEIEKEFYYSLWESVNKDNANNDVEACKCRKCKAYSKEYVRYSNGSIVCFTCKRR
jgi:formylmethanofuran dehydrogenase subunit E